MIKLPRPELPLQANDQIVRPWANFFQSVFNACFSLYQSGTTAQRPTVGLWTGRSYFDTTLGYPIWYEGPGWVNASGTGV